MKNKAILCVDDDELVLDSLNEQLYRYFGENYSIECAQNADEAWEIIDEFDEKQFEILIIISDWQMPGLKGDDFLIAVHQKFPKIITMFLTGQADDASIGRAKQYANLYHCFTKPWNEVELVETIKSGLENL